jgi:uncharacterized protein
VYYYTWTRSFTVNLPRFPLRFNVGFLLNQPVGYSRDIHFEYPEIILKPDLTLTDFSGTARVGRTPQGIIVQGQFVGKAPAECVRCLTNFDQPLHATFSELYAFDQRSITDSGLILPEDFNIDLEPVVREYLLIEMPISPICREDCQGLCPLCGLNLNEITGEHSHPEEDEVAS